MENQDISIEVSHHNLDDDPGTVAGSLRHSAKKHRREILASHGYHALWLGQISRERYAELLLSHYWFRKNLEEIFNKIGASFVVENQFFDTKKVYLTEPYGVTKQIKSTDLCEDYMELVGRHPREQPLPPKAQALVDYINKIYSQYSVALLGIAHMLDETQCYAGPRIVTALNDKLKLGGKATRYLRGRGDEKRTLWSFRRSLNAITDFQTQANIVIASTFSYRKYRDFIDPYATSVPDNDSRYHA